MVVWEATLTMIARVIQGGESFVFNRTLTLVLDPDTHEVVRDHETGNELKIAKPNVDLVPAGGPRALRLCTCGGPRIAHRLRSRYTHITDTLDAGWRSATPWS